MIRQAAVVLAFLVFPLTSHAQDFGLDLSADPETSEQESQPQDAEQQAYDEALQSQSPSSIQATPDRGETSNARRDDGDIRDLTDVEREITRDDRVKSVQRKVYLKKGRFDVTPMFQVSVNDPYYFKLGGSLRVGYYLADTLAISVRGSLFRVQPDDSARLARRVFNSQLFYSVPKWSVMGNAEWSPIYGKVAFLNSILHFDAYLLGGLGAVNTETSSVETSVGVSRGPSPATDIGVGARFVARDFLAVNVAIINTTYVDQPKGTTKGAIQNLMTLNVGVSLFIPFKSTGREAE